MNRISNLIVNFQIHQNSLKDQINKFLLFDSLPISIFVFLTMFNFFSNNARVQSPSSLFQTPPVNRPPYHRYSSVEQCYSRQHQDLSTSKINSQKQQKNCKIAQKTQGLLKQRAHSQKKLTLISAQPSNGSYICSLGQNIYQNFNTINVQQTYENFKKNVQIGLIGSNKNMGLEKKGKLNQTKTIGFTSSMSTVNLNRSNLIKSKENEEECRKNIEGIPKDSNKAIIESNNINNYQVLNYQSYNKEKNIRTASNSPAYNGCVNELEFQGNSTQISSSLSPTSTSVSSSFIMKYCQQKISQLKEQTNVVLQQNSQKIKELESLLLKNRQELQLKDSTIRQLQLKIFQKQKTKHQIPNSNYSHSSTSTQEQQREPSVPSAKLTDSRTQIKKNDFLSSRITDLSKKIQVVSKWLQEQQQEINKKIDTINTYMDAFVSVKFHNLKFALKTFVVKVQKKINTIADSIIRVQNIVQISQVDSYQLISSKVKMIGETLKKHFGNKITQKYHFDDMKATMNTVIESCNKQKINQKTYEQMFESTERHESFWNNLQDFSLHQSKFQQDSFTDDSFSYAPGGYSQQQLLNNNSSVNQFALRSYPSFQKFSAHLYNDSFHSMGSSIAQNQTNCIKTIQEISKYRKGPIRVYFDRNNTLRYKQTSSYIFDRQGNVLKPSKAQIKYCTESKLITIQ